MAVSFRTYGGMESLLPKATWWLRRQHIAFRLPDWVEALLTADLDNAALGGHDRKRSKSRCKSSERSSCLRYTAYAPPQVKREVRDLAADNAVYRRSDLLRHQDLLQRGFWEPSFHRRFRAEGICLELDPSLRVVHRNRYSARQFIAQRLAHGREFGLTRARARPVLQRMLLALMAPGIFLVLLGRILSDRTSKTRLAQATDGGLLLFAGFSHGVGVGRDVRLPSSLRARQT